MRVYFLRNKSAIATREQEKHGYYVIAENTQDAINFAVKDKFAKKPENIIRCDDATDMLITLEKSYHKSDSLEKLLSTEKEPVRIRLCYDWEYSRKNHNSIGIYLWVTWKKAQEMEEKENNLYLQERL